MAVCARISRQIIHISLCKQRPTPGLQGQVIRQILRLAQRSDTNSGPVQPCRRGLSSVDDRQLRFRACLSDSDGVGSFLEVEC